MNSTDIAMNNWLQAVDLDPKHVLAWTNLMALLDNTGNLNGVILLCHVYLHYVTKVANHYISLLQILQ